MILYIFGCFRLRYFNTRIALFHKSLIMLKLLEVRNQVKGGKKYKVIKKLKNAALDMDGLHIIQGFNLMLCSYSVHKEIMCIIKITRVRTIMSQFTNSVHKEHNEPNC